MTTESSERHTGFRNSCSDLIINHDVHCSGESASQIYEFIKNLVMSIHSDSGFNVRVFHVLVGVQRLPFCADCEIIVIT